MCVLAQVKRHVVTAAEEAAEMILRVDNIFQSAPRLVAALSVGIPVVCLPRHVLNLVCFILFLGNARRQRGGR